MKALLLYLSLFGLVWAQSELQPHYEKAKEKCMGEHQITVKGRNANHRYYIFHYIYSSLMPSNQTWIKEEEDDNTSISSGQDGPDKEKVPRRPLDNHTEEKEEGQKILVEMGNDRVFEDSTQNLNEHNENPSNRDIPQHHIEFIAGKARNDPTTDHTADDMDGSGDMGFLGQEERHHGTISGNEHQNQGKEHQNPRGKETSHLWGINEAVQSGISNDTKLSKDTFIKIGVKEIDASVIQETNPHSYIPKKSKDSKSKIYLDVSMKVKNATSKETGKKDNGYSDLLDKGTEENASAKLPTHFNVQGKISEDLFEKLDRWRNGGNYTSLPDTDEIKPVNEKVNYTRMHEKGDDEYAVLNWKMDGQKSIYGETKPHQKGEVRDNIMSSKHIKVADVMKPHKKLGVKDDIINGRSSSHIGVAGISKTHRTGEGEDITGRSLSQVENPRFTQAGKINQSRIISSGRLSSSGVTKSHTKSRGEVTLLGRVSVSQESASPAIKQSRKGTSEVGIIHGNSNNGIEGFHFTTAHRKKADSHDKIAKNTHRGKQGDPATQGKGNHRRGIAFQKGNEEIVKGTIGYRKAHGTADLSTDSSIRKEENSGQKSMGIKSPLTLAHGSHNYKHVAKSQEHSSYTLKNGRKLTEPSKKSSRVHNGRRSSSSSSSSSSSIAKQYHGHLGLLQRKSSRRDRKSKSRKSIRAYDSSPSSESEENSRNDSRQSYKDYQNDNPDSDQSAESMEENLSAGSNQRDDRSQMEDVYSQEDSWGHRSN